MEREKYGEEEAAAIEWPPRSYFCNFCGREFGSAQALGGHMNVHRRDRARLQLINHSSAFQNHHQKIQKQHQIPPKIVQSEYPHTLDYNYNPNSGDKVFVSPFLVPTRLFTKVKEKEKQLQVIALKRRKINEFSYSNFVDNSSPINKDDHLQPEIIKGVCEGETQDLDLELRLGLLC